MINSKFCVIYVNRPQTGWRDFLFEICDYLQVHPSGDRYIETSEFSLHVTMNDEWDLNKASVFPDGFLFFPFRVEIDLIIDSQAFRVALINKLLSYFWARSYPAVASCQFEDLLVNKGGYNNKDLPWMH